MVKKIAFCILMVISIVAGSYLGRVSNSFELMNKPADEKLSDVDLSKYDTVSDNEIVNILLIGTDARDEMGQEKYGRSDSMLIATLDNKHKCLKLTSLMRDMYLEIPGYGQDKFNSAFSFGGPKLLHSTIASNFGLKADGYVEVGFDAFKDIVNEVKGVRIKITEEEANYLNTTNYVRGRKNRNLKPGWNNMNGAQALGYCRVRKVSNINGTANDQGRTERQRMVMNAIFAKVKAMPTSKWLDILDVVMPNITTDLSNNQIMKYAISVSTMGTTDIINCRIPVEGYYSDYVTESGAKVLEVDVDANKRMLQEFLFEYDGKGSCDALPDKK